MENFNCDSYCGIYCGACDIMTTYKTGQKTKLASLWNESRVKAFHNKLGIVSFDNKPFTYKCNGCKSDTLFINCDVCQIRKCANDKNIEHCIDCEKYPCDIIGETKKFEPLLPHLKSNYTNMKAINKVGVNQWLSDQENKWKCPNCKTGFSWYTRKCKNCGENLKKYSFKFSFLQSIILKLGILTLSKK